MEVTPWREGEVKKEKEKEKEKSRAVHKRGMTKADLYEESQRQARKMDCYSCRYLYDVTNYVSNERMMTCSKIKDGDRMLDRCLLVNIEECPIKNVEIVLKMPPELFYFYLERAKGGTGSYAANMIEVLSEKKDQEILDGKSR